MLQKARVSRNRLIWIVGVALTLTWLGIYLLTVSPTVNFIDSGELITALHEPGIAHAPGYPLYVLMGYVLSHLLWGEVAWRVNVFSALWAAMAVGVFYLLIVEITGYVKQKSILRPFVALPKSRRARQSSAPTQVAMPGAGASTTAFEWVYLLSAAAGASLLGASASFWSRAVQAKMYSLHYFFVGLLFLLALKYRAAYERQDERAARRWLAALVALTCLSLTNHLMTNLLVPGLLVMVFWGRDWQARMRGALRSWKWLLPALLPLLLYLYLPYRASQQPFMDWGSPDNWGDFWRHVTGWQFRAYVASKPEDIAENARRLRDFAGAQWGLLSWPLILLSLGASFLLARARFVVFVATLATALATVLFSLAYPISEIEPYMVPLYSMLIVWLGCVATSLPSLFKTASQRTRKAAEDGDTYKRNTMVVTAALSVLAVFALVSQYPRQDHSRDHLAESFALNVFSDLPRNSIVITDYWDFYAPTLYLQRVQGVRPDLTIIDMSLLKYPWYLLQLEQKAPWLVERSRDIVNRFRPEQLKWVNDQPYNGQALNNSYFELIDSFVGRNLDEHQAYVLFTPTGDSTKVAQGYSRVPAGLAWRLLPQSASPSSLPLPPEPQYDLRGITHDFVPMDEFGHLNASRYIDAYGALSQLFTQAKQPEIAKRMADMAAEVEAALKGR